MKVWNLFGGYSCADGGDMGVDLPLTDWAKYQDHLRCRKNETNANSREVSHTYYQIGSSGDGESRWDLHLEEPQWHDEEKNSTKDM